MNITEVKETLEAVGYPVSSDDWEGLRDELHTKYKQTLVGRSILKLGNATPLYVRSGNAAHLVDDVDDLYTACLAIKQRLDADKAAQPIVIPADEYAYNLKVIKKALDAETSHAQMYKRDLSHAPEDYLTTGSWGEKYLTNTQQVMDDLLSDDQELNLKAVEAFKAILILKRA